MSGVGRRELLALAVLAAPGWLRTTRGEDRSAKTTSTPAPPGMADRLAGLERTYDARGLGYTCCQRTRVPRSPTAPMSGSHSARHSRRRSSRRCCIRYPLTHLDTLITYGSDTIRSASPVTAQHLQTGMTIGELCDAAVRYSDGTAANLLLDDIGGPAEFTAYLRGLGERPSAGSDQANAALDRDAPGDQRDTADSRAVGGIYQQLVLGDALTPDSGPCSPIGWNAPPPAPTGSGWHFAPTGRSPTRPAQVTTDAPTTSLSCGRPRVSRTSSRSCRIAPAAVRRTR